MLTIDVVQGTQEWKQARCGRVTSSRVSDVLATLKSGSEAASRKNYRAQLIAEILTGQPAEDQYISVAMAYGTEMEPFARAAYELQHNQTVDTIGFAIHPNNDRFGASCDGLVGHDGLVEIKVPNTATHLEYLLAGVVPNDYQPQMLAEMACTGRQWCDFVSFDPRLPSNLQLFVSRYPRDEKRIAEIEQKVEKFIEEVDGVLSQLERIRGRS